MKAVLIKLTPENCEAVVGPLYDYHLTISKKLEEEMTRIQAQLVRAWRVDLNCTYGGVAQRWSEFYPWDNGGQILGKALCYQAATLLSEDPHNDPWN